MGIAVILVADLLMIGLMTRTFPWMSLTGGDPSHGSYATATAKTTDTLFTPAGQSPAEVAIDTVMSLKPAQFHGDGWKTAATATGIPGLTYSFACGPTPGPAAMYATTRSWAQSTGPLPSDLNVSVTVTANAYGAGEGALALHDITGHAANCGAPVTTMSGLGVEAATVNNNGFSTLIWRRGDVLIEAQVRGSNPQTFTPTWTLYDKALNKALATSCANQRSALADSARAPFGGGAYTGNTVKTIVTAPGHPHPTATATPSSTPSTGNGSGTASPSPSVPLTPSMPPMPSSPVTPSALPTPVAVPIAPKSPTPPPITMAVPKQVADPVGPGCGWAFTRQVAPAFDASAADSTYQNNVTNALATMATDWETWQTTQATYATNYATYTRTLAKYLKYVHQLDRTAAAWNALIKVRVAYTTALKAYEKAYVAFKNYTLAKNYAQQQYTAEVATCGKQATPPTPATTPVCPPVKPAILAQPAPKVPARPAAPDASFPEYANRGHKLTTQQLDALVAPQIVTPSASPTPSPSSTPTP